MKDVDLLASPYTEHLEEHVQKYWTKLYQTSKDENPALDLDGSKHAVNTDPVYCACDMTGKGEPVIRTLNISADKSIFIPVNDVGVSDREHPGADANDLKRRAKKDEDSATKVKLTIDNDDYDLKDFKNKKYRIGNPIGPFEVVIPANPIGGLEPPGPAMVVADGYYLIIKPLPAGDHIIRIEAGVSEQHKKPGPWDEDVTYKIHVT
jgi:hypothetical protein